MIRCGGRFLTAVSRTVHNREDRTMRCTRLRQAPAHVLQRKPQNQRECNSSQSDCASDQACSRRMCHTMHQRPRQGLRGTSNFVILLLPHPKKKLSRTAFPSTALAGQQAHYTSLRLHVPRLRRTGQTDAESFSGGEALPHTSNPRKGFRQDGIDKSTPAVRNTTTAATVKEEASNVIGTMNQRSGNHTIMHQQQTSSLQKLLGMTDAEAETLREDARTTRRVYSNLVEAATETDTVTEDSNGVDDDERDEDAGREGPGHSDGGEGGRDDADDQTAAGRSKASAPSSFARFLLEDLGAKPSEVKALVLRNPVVLRSSTQAVSEVSQWLQSELGMDDKQVARLLVRAPQAGQLSVDTLALKVSWLRENLSVDSDGLVKVLGLAPRLLCRSIENLLEPQLTWLQDRFKISKDTTTKMIRACPHVLMYSVENKLEPTIVWLRERLEVENEGEVLDLLVSCPGILGMNVETGIEPKLTWLRDRVGLTPDQICRLIRSHPRILNRSIERTLEPKYTWLVEELNLSKAEASLLLLRYPPVLGASLEGNLKRKLPWLQETLKLTHVEAVAITKRAPSLLALSIEGNLDPTFHFYRDEMQATEEQLVWSLNTNPALFTLSLSNRLRPRAAAMRRAGLAPIFSMHQNHVIWWSNSKFDAFLASSKER